MAPYTDPVQPIEFQSQEAKARRAAREAQVLRWICGESIEGEPILRTDLEQMGFTVVRKEVQA